MQNNLLFLDRRLSLTQLVMPQDIYFNDWESIASAVEKFPKWLAYVKEVNSQGIPRDPYDILEPLEAWKDKQHFHPNELIPEACRALGWYSVPENSLLEMRFIDAKHYFIMGGIENGHDNCCQ